MAKKVEKVDTHFNIRITNIDTFNKIQEVMQECGGIYANRNDLINRCINLSIDEVLSTVRGKHEKLYHEHESKCDELAHELHRRGKKWDSMLKELSINDMITEKLLCTLFNMLVYQHAGKILSTQDIERGLYTELPKFLQDFVRELSH